MKFEKISIRNFRNFENIEIGISNKNIFFGLNDIGIYIKILQLHSTHQKAWNSIKRYCLLVTTIFLICLAYIITMLQ